MNISIKGFLLYIALLCVSSHISWAYPTDSTTQNLNLNNLQDYLQEGKLQKSLDLLNKWKATTPNDSSLAIAYKQIGQYFQKKNSIDSSILYLQKSWDIMKKLDYNQYFDNYLPDLAYRYWEKGNYSQSLKYLMEAERNINYLDSTRLKTIYNIFGINYSEIGNYQLAEEYFNKSLKISLLLDDHKYAGTVYANLGNLFFKQDDHEKALKYFRLGSGMEMKYDNHKAAGRSFRIMADIYLEKNQPPKALDFLKKAKKQNKLAEDAVGLCRTENGFGNYYLYQHNISKAITHLEMAKEKALATGAQKELMNSYEGLYKTYSHMQQYEEAFAYLEKYHQLYKTSFNLDEIIKNERLQHKLNLQQEINKRQEAKIHNQDTVTRLLSVIIGLAVILVVFLIVILVRTKRIRKFLEKKNEKIQLQKSELQSLNKELSQAKAKTEESERLKDQFLRNLSHEIRTPLNGIMGFSALIAESNVSKQDRVSYHHMIEKNAKTLLNTIDDILDIAKIKTHQVEKHTERIDIHGMLKELKKLFFFDKTYIHKNHLDIIAQAEEFNQPYFIKTDPYKLRKILLVLIDNSLKFTDSGHIRFGYQKINSSLRFFVEDTGIGIERSNRQQIFNSFSQGDYGLTRKYEGVGLGLTIAKSFTEILGGEIWFESKRNCGTTFYFTIPVQ